MTEPTEHRIEVAAIVVSELACSGDAVACHRRCGDRCECWQQARAALTADAPFAASEYKRGLFEAYMICKNVYEQFESAGNQAAAQAVHKAATWIDSRLAAIDARLSALKETKP